MEKTQKNRVLIKIISYLIGSIIYAMFLTYINHHELLTKKNFLFFYISELKDLKFLFGFFVTYEVIKYFYIKFLG